MLLMKSRVEYLHVQHPVIPIQQSVGANYVEGKLKQELEQVGEFHLETT
jgi:hypothetical protein